ncbi:MAG: SDR family NAD(P)-dependent oxidoreductase [Acidimicrobiales bacterium]
MTQKLSRSVAGKVTVITGAASGMGRAAAGVFADEGAPVILLDQSTDALDDVVDRLRGDGATVWAAAVDLTRRKDVETAMDQARAEIGPIDILVNNAGISTLAPIDSPDLDREWERVMGVNLEAAVMMIRLSLEDLKRDGGGRIVNIASTEGLGATRGILPYTVSKHGVIGLTRAVAMDLGRAGVTCNCICPGPIETAMTDPIPADVRAAFAKRRVPLGRYGTPEEVAHAVLSLALPASSYINGAILCVDGGLMVQNT